MPANWVNVNTTPVIIQKWFSNFDARAHVAICDAEEIADESTAGAEKREANEGNVEIFVKTGTKQYLAKGKY